MKTRDHQSLALKTTGIFLILLIAFALRITMVTNTLDEFPIRNDGLEYFNYSVNMKFHNTYSRQAPKPKYDTNYSPTPDKVRPPGYSLFLYPFVTLPADKAMILRIHYAQVIIDTLTVLLTFMLIRLFVAYKIALFTAFLVAISPHLITMNIYFLSETLFTFSLMIYIYITTLSLQKQNSTLIFLNGFLLAITMLIKPTMNYFLPFICIMSLLTLPKEKRFKIFGIILLSTTLTIAPWLIRNLNVNPSKPSIALSTLKYGSYLGLMVNNDPKSRGIQPRADPSFHDIKTYSEFFSSLVEKASKQPGEYLSWYLFGKAIAFYSWDVISDTGDVFIYPLYYSPYTDDQTFIITHALMKGGHNVVVISSLILLVLLFIPAFRRRLPEPAKIPLTLCAVVMLYFTLLHMAGNPLPRYAIPLRPIQLLMSIYLFSFLYDTYKSYQKNIERDQK